MVCQPEFSKRNRPFPQVDAGPENVRSAMIETNCSNGDSGSASGREPETKRRVTVFVLLLALAIGLVAYVEANTWRQLDRLRNDFAGANLESFYLGVHLRETV